MLAITGFTKWDLISVPVNGERRENQQLGHKQKEQSQHRLELRIEEKRELRIEEKRERLHLLNERRTLSESLSLGSEKARITSQS